jgi:hypothetical protein
MVVVLLFVLTGCSSHVANFTILSTRNVDLTAVDRQDRKLDRADGDDGRFWFLFIPFGGSPSVEVATNECLDNGHGNFVVDGELYSNFTTVLLFTWEGYRMTGKVGRAVSPPSAVDRVGGQ